MARTFPASRVRAYLAAKFDVVSSGVVTITVADGSRTKPRPLTHVEIDEFVELCACAAKNAIRAEFDSIEVNAANGYLIDQFIQTPSNNRTDEYGQIRFPLRVVRAVRDAVGGDRTVIRLSPYERYQGMYVPADVRPTFSALIRELATLNLVYLLLTDPRVFDFCPPGNDDPPGLDGESLDWVLDIFRPQPVILCGGYKAESALQRVEEGKASGDELLIAVYGRYFISKPDLPVRIQHGVPFAPYDRKTLYARVATGLCGLSGRDRPACQLYLKVSRNTHM